MHNQFIPKKKGFIPPTKWQKETALDTSLQKHTNHKACLETKITIKTICKGLPGLVHAHAKWMMMASILTGTEVFAFNLIQQYNNVHTLTYKAYARIRRQTNNGDFRITFAIKFCV